MYSFGKNLYIINTLFCLEKGVMLVDPGVLTRTEKGAEAGALLLLHCSQLLLPLSFHSQYIRTKIGQFSLPLLMLREDVSTRTRKYELFSGKMQAFSFSYANVNRRSEVIQLVGLWSHQSITDFSSFRCCFLAFVRVCVCVCKHIKNKKWRCS